MAAPQQFNAHALSAPADYLAAPLRILDTNNDAALMSGVARDGSRVPDTRRMSAIIPIQTYIIRNNSTIYDRGENTIYAPPRGAYTEGNFFDQCIPVFSTKITRDGSILGYMIRDYATKKELVKIHVHGDTSSTLSRTFKAFIRSPVLKWDVENYGLYSDLPNGANMGKITEVFPDNRIFTPNASMIGVPRLEMQVAASLGLRYYLAVTDVPEPVGEVDSSLIARFAPRSETYALMVRNCTREESILWLTMVIATDMKRRKSQNTKYGRSFLYF